MTSCIKYFLSRGRRIGMACRYISNPQRLRQLVMQASRYTNRKELKKLGEEFSLLWHYVSDVATRRYTHYNTKALLITVAALIYLITPLDFLPDVLIGGLIDDLSVLIHVIQSVKKELENYKLHIVNADKLDLKIKG